MSLIDEYFEYQDKFEGKYGINTIVLMLKLVTNQGV